MYDYDLEKLQNLSHGERCYQHLVASLALYKNEILKIKVSGNLVNIITDYGIYRYQVYGFEKDHFLDLVQKNFDIIPEHQLTRWGYENEVLQK